MPQLLMSDLSFDKVHSRPWALFISHWRTMTYEPDVKFLWTVFCLSVEMCIFCELVFLVVEGDNEYLCGNKKRVNMNRKLLIALLLVCVTSQAQTSFTLTTKKVNIEAQSFIHPWSTLSFDKATKYHGDYYCHLTEHISDPNLMIGCDHIFCVAPDGKNLQRVSKSETTRLGMYDEMVYTGNGNFHRCSPL